VVVEFGEKRGKNGKKSEPPVHDDPTTPSAAALT
jgi:hypothetical protein